MKTPKRIQCLVPRYGSTGKVDFDNGETFRSSETSRRVARHLKRLIRKEGKQQIDEALLDDE